MKFLLTLLVSASAFAGNQSVELAAQVITFAPTKGEVQSSRISLRCLRKASLFDWGNNGGKEYVGCDDFVVNGRPLSKTETYTNIELKKIGPNQFMFDGLAASFSDSKKGHLCLTVDAPVTGAMNVNNYDRYSVLGYCTVAELPFSSNEYIYNNNRKATLGAFKATLAAPVVIQTK